MREPPRTGTAPTPPPIPTSELEASQSNLYIAPNISFLESLLIIKKKHDKKFIKFTYSVPANKST